MDRRNGEGPSDQSGDGQSIGPYRKGKGLVIGPYRKGKGLAIGPHRSGQAKKLTDEQKMDRNDDEIRQTGVTVAAFQSLRAVIDEVETVCGAISNQSVQAKLLDACYSSVDDLRKESRRAIDNQRRHFQEQMLRFEEIVATQSQENQENRDPRHEHRDVIAAHVIIEEEEEVICDDDMEELGKEILSLIPEPKKSNNLRKEKLEILIKLKIAEPALSLSALYDRAAQEHPHTTAKVFENAYQRLINKKKNVLLKRKADALFHRK